MMFSISAKTSSFPKISISVNYIFNLHISKHNKSDQNNVSYTHLFLFLSLHDMIYMYLYTHFQNIRFFSMSYVLFHMK